VWWPAWAQIQYQVPQRSRASTKVFGTFCHTKLRIGTSLCWNGSFCCTRTLSVSTAHLIRSWSLEHRLTAYPLVSGWYAQFVHPLKGGMSCWSSVWSGMPLSVSAKILLETSCLYQKLWSQAPYVSEQLHSGEQEQVSPKSICIPLLRNVGT